MMIHPFFIEGVAGSIAKLNPFTEFFYKTNSKIVENIFKGFLSDSEIRGIQYDTTLWLSEEEMIKRFKKIGKI